MFGNSLHVVAYIAVTISRVNEFVGGWCLIYRSQSAGEGGSEGLPSVGKDCSLRYKDHDAI
jgi:hypothetical protein